MRKIIINLIIFLVFIFGYDVAFGAIYFVRTDGHDGAAGTADTTNASTGAWLTIQHAADVMTAGDTVLVAPGTYASWYTTTDGTETYPITFRAMGTVLINSGMGSGGDMIRVYNDYTVIDGFNQTGATRYGIRVVDCVGVVVKNCYSYSNGSTNIFSGYAPGVQILNNYTRNAGEHGIYVSNSNVSTDSPIIKNNVSYANAGSGIQLNGDCETTPSDGWIDGFTIDSNVVRGNTGKGLSIIAARNGTIKNNLIYSNGPAAGGIHLVNQPGCESYGSSGNTVVNNTIVESGQAGIRINGTSSTGNIIFNNVIISSTPYINEDGATPQYHDTGSSLEQSSTTGVFVNTSLSDYRLASGSSARNRAIATYQSKTAPTTDHDDRSRSLDAGAYEYTTHKTRFVNKWGSDSSNTCVAEALPCASVGAAQAAMSGGDTIIVGPGFYAGDQDDMIKDPPSGTSGAYTIFKARDIGRTTLDVSAAGSWLSTAIGVGSGHNYIQVEGFRVKGNATNENSNGPVILDGTNVKLLRCAIYNACATNTNMQAVSVGGTNVLVEECWAWGGARYKFLAYKATNTIFRRCVARHDYITPQLDGSGFPNQEALFTNYDSTGTQMQNCIGIDSDYISAGQHMYGAFWDEQNDVSWPKTGKIVGSIALNIQNAHAAINDRPSSTRSWTNVVIWNCDGGYRAQSLASPTPHYTLSKLTIGNINGAYPGTFYAKGVGAGSLENIDITISDSIIYDADTYGLADYITNNYLLLYSNGTNYGAAETSHTPTGGANNITNRSPLTNGLLYLPRIESGSFLKTAGSGGSQIGAEIMYKHGTSETLYGETGYDTLTSSPLWPFPNESLIKADFASYNALGPVGNRGFAAATNSMDGTPQTLTKYIWEYLGNQIPVDIYGGSSDTTAPISGINTSFKNCIIHP